MKAEEQILELLTEVLCRQAQTQGDTLLIKAELQTITLCLDDWEENQRTHQQILRTLAVNQQNHQRELEGITDILDSTARMQRNQNRHLDRLENPSDFV